MANRVFPRDTTTIKVAVLCLVVATTFWFFNALNDDYAATIYYPVQFDYDEETYIETSDLPDEVQINVSGLGWAILRQGYLFDAEPIAIPIQDPERSRRISGNSLIGDLSEGLIGLQLNYILNDSLFLDIERRTSKKIKVLFDSAGVDLSEDHHIVSTVLCNLDSVTILGPESMIDTYPDTTWVRVGDRRIDSNFDRDVQIETFNDLVSLDPPAARITFDVEEFFEVSRLIRLTELNFPEDSSVVLADSTIELTFWISESRSKQIANSDFEIVVDYEKMVSYDSTIQALIRRYPLDIRGLDIAKSRAKVVYPNLPDEE